MAYYDEEIQDVLEMVKEFGQLVDWRIINDPVPPDPNKPWNPGVAVPTDNKVHICFLPINRQTFETFSFLKGTVIGQGAVMGLMGQVSFDPTLKDVVIRDGKELRIEAIDVLSPNGQKLLYTVIFKQ